MRIQKSTWIQFYISLFGFMFMKKNQLGGFPDDVWGVIWYWNNSFCIFFFDIDFLIDIFACFFIIVFSVLSALYWWMIQCWLDIFYEHRGLNSGKGRLVVGNNNLWAFCFKLFSTYLEFQFHCNNYCWLWKQVY